MPPVPYKGRGRIVAKARYSAMGPQWGSAKRGTSRPRPKVGGNYSKLRGRKPNRRSVGWWQGKARYI